MVSKSKMGLVTALIFASFFGSATTILVWESVHRPAQADDVSRIARQQLQHAKDLSEAFQLSAKAVQPSVVSIASVRKIRAARRTRPDLPEELRRFFGGDDPFGRFSPGPERDLEQQGMGSGVIVSEDGYIVTNNHVIDGADELTVIMHDRRQLKAEIIGRDKDTDVAVLKVKAPGLVAAPFGNSDSVEVGQWVLAIGTPMNLRQSVTAGIISATGRAVGITGGGFEDFLQTDAAINPGNSGGPLVNLQGEVIGINTAIASQTGGFMGIGFAIPANMVHSVMDQIVKQGKVVRGRIGAVVSDVSDDVGEKLGYGSTNGALIQDVVSDGPAARAGLEPGDVVTHYQGHEVKSSNQFRNAVAATPPGTRAEVSVFRNGATKTIKVEIAELDSKQLVNGRDEVESESGNDLGIATQALTPEIARQLGLSETRGVVVAQVEPGSLAQRAGVQAGDVILSVNRKAVTSLNEYREAMKLSNLDKGVLLQIRHEGVSRFVVLRSR